MKILVPLNELDVVQLRDDVHFLNEAEEKPFAGHQGTIVHVWQSSIEDFGFPSYIVEFYRGEEQEPALITIRHNQLNLVKAYK